MLSHCEIVTVICPERALSDSVDAVENINRNAIMQWRRIAWIGGIYLLKYSKNRALIRRGKYMEVSEILDRTEKVICRNMIVLNL
jgi:hypothetical protein